MFEKFAEVANSLIRDMYQTVFDLNSTAVLVDQEGRVNYVWRNIASFEEYVLRVEIGEIVYGREQNIAPVFHAVTAGTFSEMIITNSKGKDMYAIGSPICDADGSMLGSLLFFNPLNTGNVGIIRGMLKITVTAIESKWTAIGYKEDYETMYNKFMGAMQTVPLGTLVTDENLIVTDINEATMQILNKNRDEIIGKNIDALLKADGFFQKAMVNKSPIIDKEVNFHLDDGDLDCEVLISYLNSSMKEQNKGMVIKLKNSKYLQEYKQSKDYRKAQFYFEDIIGTSDELKEVIRLGKLASRSMSNVLLLGDSGTGKEMIAQAIHNYSLRKEGPFVAVNCGAMTSSLIESELFGYEAGAFTGASKEGKQGKFEQANGGTLFLDEIGDMPLENQVSLLRVLQNKELVRIGGNRPIKTNVRIIAATNRNIEKMVQEERFRSDLYYRLNVFSLDIPSLAERAEDIIPLAERFIEKYNIMLAKKITGIDEEAERVLKAHSWMGNIRELENVIERAINVSESHKIIVRDLPKNLQKLSAEAACQSEDAFRELNRVQRMEKQEIISELKRNGGNISKTADMLGIGRRSIYRRLQIYGIDPGNYKK